MRILLLILFWCCGWAETVPAMRIVCVGDSITQGRRGQGEHLPTFSYRYPLWKMLIDRGVAVDFVGSVTTGFEGSPTYAPHQGREFPNRHEAHWGWTTAQVAGSLAQAVEGKTWQADVAIVMLGTNDPDTKTTLEPTLAAMRAIVASLRRNNSSMRIIIGRPFQEWEPFPALGAAYEALARELSTSESPVTTVVTSTGWVSKPDVDGSTTIDWVHPNADGDAKLATAFAAALMPPK